MFLALILHDWWLFQKVEATYWEFLKYSNKCLRMCSSQLNISENVFIAIWYKCSYFNHFKAFFFFFCLKHNYSHFFRSCLVSSTWFISWANINAHSMLSFSWWKIVKAVMYGLIQLSKADEYHLKQRNKTIWARPKKE